MRNLKTILFLLFAVIWTNAFAQTTFSLSQSEIACGEQTCLQVSVQGFTNILAFQYSMNWDAAVLGNATVQSFGIGDLAVANFNLATPGIARIGWDDSNTTGISLTDNTVIFEICFDEIGGNTATSIVQFSDNPIAIEVIDAQGVLITPNFNNGAVAIDCGTMDGGDNTTSALTFSATQATANCGEQACVNVNVSGFSNILTFQYAMNWDANLLGTATVQSFGIANMDASQFNTITPGVLRVGYDDSSLQGVSLSDNSLLFQVCFELANDATGSSDITFSTNPIPIEVIDVQGNIIAAAFQSGNIAVSCDSDNTGGESEVSSDLSFSVGQQTANCGDQVCVAVRADGFTDIISFQYAMNWDASLLSNPVIRQFGLPDMNMSQFNTTTPGILRVGYDDSSLQGRSLPDNAVLYQLCFSLTTDVSGISDINFSDNPIAIEVIDVQSNILTPILQSGSLTIACADTPTMDTMPPLPELPLGFSIAKDTSNCGDQVCLDVSVQGFVDITSFRYSINWNAQLMGSEEILTTNLDGIRFGSLAPGVFFTEWIDPTRQGVTLPDNEIIYTICFNQFTSRESTAAVSFSNVPIPIRVTNPNTSNLRPALTPGEVLIMCTPIDMDTVINDQADSLSFAINNTSGNCGERACLAVTAQDFNKLFSFQYSIAYNANLGGVSVQNFGLEGLSAANFNLTQPGFVRVGWDDSSLEGVSIPDDQVLFDICFGIGTNIVGGFEVAFSNTPLAIEAVDVAGNILTPNFQDGALIVACEDTTTPIDTTITPETLQLSISDGIANCGEQTCLAVTAQDFNNIFSFQYSIAYNASLGAASVQNFGLEGLSGANFNLAEPGTVRVGWDDSSLAGVSIPDDQVLFDICFDVGASIVGDFDVTFSNMPLAIEAVDVAGNILTPDFQGGALIVACEDTTLIDTTITPETLQLFISDGTANCGEQACLAVTAKDFNNIFSFQYSIAYNASLGAASVQNFGLEGLSGANFNLAEPGAVRVGWDDSSLAGVSIPDDQVLFDICFDVGVSIAGNFDVTFSNTPLTIEVVDVAGNILTPNFQDGVLTVACEDTTPIDTTVTPETLQLSISDGIANCGEQTCLAVTAQDFNNIFSLQYSIVYNASLGLASVQNFGLAGLSGANFNLAEPGVVRVGWDDSSLAGVSVPDDQVLFDICFDVGANIVGGFEVTFSNTPLVIEAVDVAGNILNYSFHDGTLTVGCEDTTPVDTATTPETLQLSISDGTVNCGEQICIDVTAKGFRDILSFQYSINWDPNVLSNASLQNFNLAGLGAGNFNAGAPGIIRAGWTDANVTGVTMAEDAVLYQICFDAIGEDAVSTDIRFSNIPLPIEVLDGDAVPIEAQFKNGIIRVECMVIEPPIDTMPTNSSDELTFIISPTTGVCTDEVCMNVSVQNFNNILTYQYSINWDVNLLGKASVQGFNMAGLNASNFNTAAPGVIRIGWDDSFVSGVSLPDNQVIYQICFDNINAAVENLPISFSGTPTSIEVIDNQSNLVEPTFIDGSLTVTCDDGNNGGNPTEGDLIFRLSPTTANCGQQICTDVRVDGFNDILTLQYSIIWDAAALGTATIQSFGVPGLNTSNFNNNTAGILRVGWDDPFTTGVTLPNDHILFEVCFDSVDEPINTTDTRFAGTPTSIEVIDRDGQAVLPIFQDGSIIVNCDTNTPVDADNDGFANDVDCDDNNASINPNGVEIPNNGIDEDCDGVDLIENVAIDADNDGFANDVDCDDNNASINPNGVEIPNNGIDEDCNGTDLVIVFPDNDGDGFTSDVDCDDTNPIIFPGATEFPNNNVDEDCDGIALIIDADNDGFNSSIDCDDTNPNINGRATEIPDNGIDEDCDGEDLVTDSDGDGFAKDVDCDDTNPNINPDATEIPNNGIDEDCNGTDLVIVFPDNDGDGFTSDVDCDDTNPIVFPGATEFPNNNVDEDCDGIALIIDADNDGFNSSIDCDDTNPNINGRATEIPDNGIDEDCDGEDLVTDSDGDGFAKDVDCDDTNPNINPGATEIPNNGIDEDCNGTDLVIVFPDNDGDGFTSDVDCDDTNPIVFPGATEYPNNNVDEDCDGIALIIDADNDGFNSSIDCDDTNPNINGRATEIPDNGIDEDCDGEDLVTDSDGDGFAKDVDCDDTNPNINPGATEIPNNGIDEDCNGTDLVIVFPDNDGDGFTSDVDCDDTNPIVFPGATEYPNNNVDEDCDGIALIIDADNDGFNSSIDCDDTNPNINGRATEIPDNGIDEDCNGEDLVTVVVFPDNDGDGFTSDVDCDDNNPIVFPGATEFPNNDIDEDCDGIALFIDADNDGFNSSIDCDDTNANINPGATEIANNDIDEDCDGIALFIDADNDGFNSSLDCDDTNPNINGNATEIPDNGIDEDCNGEDLVTVVVFPDNDGDGFTSDVDCDDNNPIVFPGATEFPNNDIDEDCDGIALFIDADNDGFNSSLDCDDTNADINPEATEIANNDIDEDCDGIALFIDADNDGFNSSLDCDDTNADINPGATEIANNDIDEDCDGIALFIDADNDGFNSSIDCDDTNAAINPSATEIANNDIDEDCDGIALFIDADNDGFNSSIDCDDTNAAINPSATEIANNGIDEDCNGTDLVIIFPDNDGDGFTSDVDCDDNNPIVFPGATEFPNNDVDEDCDGIALFIDADNDGFNSSIDCDDTNPNINGNATEIPDNGIDEDCNGEDLVTVVVFPDNDGDGFTSDVDCDDNNPIVFPGATEFPNNDVDEDCDGIALFIDADNDGFNSSIDCDDTNAAINPNATEIANNDIDEDCDGIALFIDADNDGFNSSLDCDDTNADINPGATEIANNDIDEDCDGIALFIDADNDGFNSSIDCDDTNAAINPSATEIANNGIDEDCNGTDLVIIFPDNDGDGFTSDVDCDDNNPIVFPGATEFPNNDIDEDCDGIALFIDADNDGFNSSIDCDDTNAAINPSATEIANNGIDEDCNGEDLVQAIDADNDGFDSDADCDDTNPAINPGATEIANNGVDEDCNGEDLVQAIDADNDGFDSDADCDDTNAAINPGATEIANNGIDEDCNGEDLVQAIDADNDGFDSDADCDDTNAAINPGATEIANNGIDEDCNGEDLIDVDTNSVMIRLPNVTATCGGQICLDATAGNFKDLISFQYSLNWNPALLGNAITQNYNLAGLNNSAFFTPEAGIMRVSWFDTNVAGVSVDDNEVLFQICFDVISSSSATAVVEFSSTSIPIEFIDNTGNEMTTNLVDAEINIENCSNIIIGETNTPTVNIGIRNPSTLSSNSTTFSDIKNKDNHNNLKNIQLYPNPTVNQLNLVLDNPLQENGAIRLYNIWGKLLQTKPIKEGDSQLKLNLGNFASGVYLVEVQEGNTFVRKRIIRR